MDKFTEKVNHRLSAPSSTISPPDKSNLPHNIICQEDESDEFMQEYNQVINSTNLPHTEEITDESGLGGDKYIGMKIVLPRGEDGALEYTIVKKRKFDTEDKPIGKPNSNIALDSRQYEVEFLNGKFELFTSNTIAENLLL